MLKLKWKDLKVSEKLEMLEEYKNIISSLYNIAIDEIDGCKVMDYSFERIDNNLEIIF